MLLSTIEFEHKLDFKLGRLSVNALMNAHAFGGNVAAVKQAVVDGFPTRDVSHLGFTENCTLNHPGKTPGKKK